MQERCQAQPRVCPPFIGSFARASIPNVPAVPRGPDLPPAAPGPGTRRAPRLAWLLEGQSMRGGGSDSAHRVMVEEGTRAEVCGGRMGQDSPVRGCPIAWCHKRGQAAPCLALRAGGFGEALQNVRMSPGGGCSQALNPQPGWRVCAPTAELRLCR